MASSNEETRFGPKVPVKDHKSFIRAQVSTKAKMEELKKKIFPVWNGHIAKIFDMQLKNGKESCTLEQLINLYPGAMKFGEEGYEGPGAKKLFIEHIEMWLKENMLVDDMMTFSRNFAAEVSKKITETKDELRGEFNPRMLLMEKRIRQLEAQQRQTDEILKKKGIYERELILIDPEQLDLGDPLYLDKIKVILEKHYSGLTKEAIQHVRKIESSQQGQERIAVIMATREQRDKICYNASIHETDKAKIKKGIPPHIRAEQVKFYPYRVAAAQFNYESQENGEPAFYRAETDKKTGEHEVKKYHKDSPQVSNTRAKAEEKLLKPHPHFKEKVHRILYPAA